MKLLAENIKGEEETDTHFIIKDKDNVKNCIGKYLHLANGPRPHPDHGKRLRDLISENTKELNSEIENNKITRFTLTKFGNNNLAYNPTESDFENLPWFSVNEVAKKLTRLPNKTSSGPDAVPCIVLKHLPPSIIKAFTTIFNNLMNQMDYPNSWKTAIVCPLLKKGKSPTCVRSFRPISLLPNMSKMFEALLMDKLTRIVEQRKSLPDQQFGFRRRMSQRQSADI